MLRECLVRMILIVLVINMDSNLINYNFQSEYSKDDFKSTWSNAIIDGGTWYDSQIVLSDYVDLYAGAGNQRYTKRLPYVNITDDLIPRRPITIDMYAVTRMYFSSGSTSSNQGVFLGLSLLDYNHNILFMFGELGYRENGYALGQVKNYLGCFSFDNGNPCSTFFPNLVAGRNNNPAVAVSNLDAVGGKIFHIRLTISYTGTLNSAVGKMKWVLEIDIDGTNVWSDTWYWDNSGFYFDWSTLAPTLFVGSHHEYCKLFLYEVRLN